MSGGRALTVSPAEHQHDWLVIVEDLKRSDRGLQVCQCGATVTRIHPVPPVGASTDVDELDAIDQLIEDELMNAGAEPFGPIASGIVRRRDLTPTFRSP